MMKFHPGEVPVAISMIELAEMAQHPFQQYFSLWAAFNTIYTLVAERQGVKVEEVLEEDGRPKTIMLWDYTFPRVRVPGERDQINEAITQLSDRTKDVIILHASTHFFVERVPRDVDGQFDSRGQRINGVLNISRTVSPELPVWSPINPDAYEQYLSGDFSQRDLLAEQIVFMLYTIRNNLVHGGKRMDDANDEQVVKMALPILEIVVKSFIR